MEGRRLVSGDLRFTVLKAIVLLTLLVALTSGCSNGDGVTPVTVAVEQEGTFIDSVVEGLEFSTETQSGLTNENGTFTYREGETVTFSTGAVVLGSGTAKPTMSPVDLVADATDETNPTVVNICRFLQSLDVDGNIDETITISSETRDALQDATPIDFTQAADAFTTDPDVQSIFDTLNSLGVFDTGDRTLRSAEEASAHLHNTLWQTNTTIMVKTPNGGETMVAGGSYEITWSASTSIDSVTILLSQDSGSTWNETPLVESTSNDGSYTWSSIPSSALGTTNRIRIVDAASSTCYDDSNSDFTVLGESEPSSLEVVSPNGGEIWQPGTSEEITWNCDPTIDNVRIDLSMDSGQTFSHVISESTPNDGVYIWESIPMEFTGQFNRIRISNAADPNQPNPIVFDVSDASFTIPAVILVVSPNGGEEWLTTTSQEITWHASPTIENVTLLLLSKQSAGVWNESLITISTPNDGSYTWLSIPSWAVGLNKRIRVIDAVHPAVYDDSNNDFSIEFDRPTLGSLWQDLQDTLEDPSASDSDGDSLTDEFEQYLGTDPNDQDTDGDGLYDFGEIFGDGIFNGQDLIPDADCDGVYAVFDPDDDNDSVNDGEFVDTDNDGIPNYLEIYGYRFNWMSGRFLPWDEEDVKNDPSVPYYKSDPLQPSTDQDPYSDSMEVSGAFMDVTVETPGDLPMVPAYPDIVVKLERYEVTLNADITTSTGTSLAKGETWNTDTYDTHTHTDESHWEVGVEVAAKFGGGSLFGGAEVKTSYTHGESEADSVTTGTVKSAGGSSLTTEDWSTARSWNPTEAAHIKLYFKFYNYGTAAANNIIPTLTLRIGGKNIATFEPGNSQINLLEPGGVYPTAPGAYWVVDTIDTGAGVVDISLTMDELRALETGAPVSVVLTQMAADVLRMTEDGVWEIVGDWNAYMSRYNAVCSNLLMDIGDGNAINYLVYSDNSSSAPKVTLRDALLWVAGGAEEGGLQLIHYYDRVNGGIGERDLAGWDFAVDRGTWDANESLWDADEDGQVDDDFNLFDLILGPNSKITGRAAHPGDVAEGRPKIHYAYFDEATSEARAYVSDYYGVESVELFLDHPDSPFAMQEQYYEGSGYYSIKIDPDYVWKETETIRAANVKAYESDPPNEDFITESDVLPVYSGPVDVLQTPFIRWVRLNHNELMLTAEVQPRGGVPIDRVYLDFVGTTMEEVELEPLAGYENVWTCRLPDGYHTPDYPELVVAVNDHGFTASSAVTDRVNVRGAGTATLYYKIKKDNTNNYHGEYINGFDVSDVQTLPELMWHHWYDGSVHEDWGASYNPDWYVTGDLVAWNYPYCPDTRNPAECWVHWVPPTQHPEPTIGLEVTQGEWAGLTRENLALMKPVMGEYGIGWGDSYAYYGGPNLIGKSFVMYQDPYFVKATVVDHNWYVGYCLSEYKVEVIIDYVVFENES